MNSFNFAHLSKSQKRALLLAAKNDGIVDTLHIAGVTGHSLFKRGYFHKHDTGDDYEGTTRSYELTDLGWTAAGVLKTPTRG